MNSELRPAHLLTWLRALRRHSRLGFIAVILFVVGQFFFTVIGIEVSPFRNYGMYSRPQAFSEMGTAIEIVGGWGVYDYEGLGDMRTEILLSPLEPYLFLHGRAFVDPNAAIFDRKFGWLPAGLRETARGRIVQSTQQLKSFPQWFAYHFTDVTGVAEFYASIDVRLLTFSYEFGKPVLIKTQTLFEWKPYL